MFDFDDLAEVEDKEPKQPAAAVALAPAAPPRPSAGVSGSLAGIDTKLSGRVDLAALEEPSAAGKPVSRAPPPAAAVPPKPAPAPSPAPAASGEGGELRAHVAAIVAATADLRTITPKLVLQGLAKRLDRPASELRPQMRLIQELARTEIQKRVAALQAGTIEVPRFSAPPASSRRVLVPRKQLEQGSVEAHAAVPLFAGDPAAAIGLLSEALGEVGLGEGRRAELLLLRGHAYWRDSRYMNALADFAEADRLQPGGSAGPSLLALRHCLGLDLEAESVRGHAEAKQLLVEAAAIHRAGSDAMAAARQLLRPRAVEPISNPQGEPTSSTPSMWIFDGRIQVEGMNGYPDAEIGYRLLSNKSVPAHEAPLLVYYHGNGEVVSDYTSWADVYHKFPCNFLAFDYRAYGWSTGEALVGCLTRDPVVCMRKLPELLQRHGLPWPWPAPVVLMGRSLGGFVVGSIIAKFPDMFDGLIIESGAASSKEQHHKEVLDWSGEHAGEASAALERLASLVAEGLPEGWPLGQDTIVPLGSCDGVRGYRGPVLILHGSRDTLVPLDNAQRHYEAATNARERDLVQIDGDHNNCAGVSDFWRTQMRFVRGLLQYKKSQQS